MTTAELNSVYGDFLNSYTKPFRIDFSENRGITRVPEDNCGAFELKHPTSSNMKLEKTQSGGVIVRYCFGYDFASKNLTDYKQGIRFLSVVQNEMLLAISPWIDWSTDPKDLFQKPGKPNLFFIELQSHAGFELRAYYDGSN